MPDVELAGATQRVATRVAIAAGSAAALGAVHVPRPATLCPLRAVTGVPCPLCGTTTALVRLGRLDAVGALAANPVTLLVLLLLVLAPAAPAMRRLVDVRIVAAGVGAAWLWQLQRFELIPI